MPDTPATRDEGRALRKVLPRGSHAWWAMRSSDGALDRIEAAARGRLPELIPVRHARMAASPFAFYRGTADVMAADLRTLPSTRIDVQICGDSHIGNFGIHGTPERALVFDVNDFDETTTGTFEWDIKRLATSIVLLAREADLPERAGHDAVRAAINAYRMTMERIAQLPVLDAWAMQLDEGLLRNFTGGDDQRFDRAFRKARANTSMRVFPKLARETGGTARIVESPPLIVRPQHTRTALQLLRGGMQEYRATLAEERRYLLDRFRIADLALKVVGVSSVGLRAYIVLLLGPRDEPLFLQAKEARPSVAAKRGRKVDHEGRRVVLGQRMLQAASDPLLGWTTVNGVPYYLRQLRNMKYSLDAGVHTSARLPMIAAACGAALARGHARSGAADLITGYLGSGDAFVEACTTFARAYADQVTADHAAFVRAIRAGRFPSERTLH